MSFFALPRMLRLLDRFPIGESLLGTAHRAVAKYVGVPAHELLADAAHHVIEREVALLLGNLRLKIHLEQQVAKLFAQRVHVILVEGIKNLGGLFEQVLLKGSMGLLLVPRTAVRGA